MNDCECGVFTNNNPENTKTKNIAIQNIRQPSRFASIETSRIFLLGWFLWWIICAFVLLNYYFPIDTTFLSYNH